MTVDIHESNSLTRQDAAASKAVLVFGATGQQGGAVATALKLQGWPVRALVRNPTSDKAKALLDLGVELFKGDFSDSDSIRNATSGAYGVFSVQPSSGQGALYGISDEQEIRYGKSVADIAIEMGVQHFVYTSVNAAGPDKTGMGHFDSKSEIEAHVRGTRLRSTIIRPAGFMELLMLPGMGLDKGVFMSFLRPGQTGQVIAVQDIGKIVATIFSDPDRFVGRTIEIAGDEVTGVTLQESLSRAAGKLITYYRFPDSLLQDNSFLDRLTSLFDDGRLAGHADIAALKSEFGHLLSFDEWLAGPGKPMFEAALQADAAAISFR
jgi:uncharacterized protein YbjT (DUF2867 family)